MAVANRDAADLARVPAAVRAAFAARTAAGVVVLARATGAVADPGETVVGGRPVTVVAGRPATADHARQGRSTTVSDEAAAGSRRRLPASLTPASRRV